MAMNKIAGVLGASLLPVVSVLTTVVSVLTTIVVAQVRPPVTPPSPPSCVSPCLMSLHGAAFSC
jgi:hypothetical protein